METSFLAHRSGRIFGPATLEDNWYEDRDQNVSGENGGKLFSSEQLPGYTRRPFETGFQTAPRRNKNRSFMGLRRTLGDDGQRHHEVTSRTDYVKPTHEPDRPRMSLVRVDTFKHTKNPRPTNAPQDGTMWSIHSRHPPDYGSRHFETTTLTATEGGLKPRDDLVLPPVGEGQDGGVCRGGHEKAVTNFHVFPFGHAKNNFKCTPGARTFFNRSSSITSGRPLASTSPTPHLAKTMEVPKRFGRKYAFTGMATRAGARVFYDEDVSDFPL